MYSSAGEGIRGHCNYSKRENYSSNIFYLVVKCRRSLYAVYFLGFQGRELYQSSLRTFDDLHLFKYGACSSLDHANHIREKPEYQMASSSQNCNNLAPCYAPSGNAAGGELMTLRARPPQECPCVAGCGKLWRARSRLYRSQILQVNTYAFESSRRDLHNALLCTAL